MTVNGTITAIATNPSNGRFDVTVNYSDGTNSQVEVLSVDPGASIVSVQAQIKSAGLKYIPIFAQKTLFNAGVSTYQQFVGAVVVVG
jgi:hypothetical protein